MGNNSKTYPLPNHQQVWSANDNSIWLASTISLHRNIEKFKFPSKLEPERQKQIVALIGKELLAGKLLDQPQLLHAEDITPLQKEFLVEHFLSSQNFLIAHAGEAFIVDSTGLFLGVVNIRDHIQLCVLDFQGELERAWGRLLEIETHLGMAVTYSFSPKYGFLTSDFNQCGTALIASIFLQLPALVHSETLDLLLEKIVDDSIAVTGIQSNPTEIIGDVIVLQNNYTLGLTEENIISNLRTMTTKLIVEENSRRSKLKHEGNVEIKDRISRAFGILIHSYQIEAIEALNAISLLKLGVELGWVKGVTIREMNSLFFNCRRAHLIQGQEESVKANELLHKRAEFIHQALKKVQLII